MNAPRMNALRVVPADRAGGSANGALSALAREADGAAMSEPAMLEWAGRLGEALPANAVVALHGELGAGKTTLVRALASHRGVRDPSTVTSPTFAILHEYETVTGGVVLHADLYRIRRPEELDQLGWDELVAAANLVCVEWPDRGGDRVPAKRYDVALAHVPGVSDARTVTLRLPVPAPTALQEHARSGAEAEDGELPR